MENMERRTTRSQTQIAPNSDYDEIQRERARPKSSADISFEGHTSDPSTINITVSGSDLSIAIHTHSSVKVDKNLKELSLKFYKLKEKALRYRTHKETLREYLKDDLVPAGLRPRISPGIDLKSDDFMVEWNNILHSTSLKLMELLIKNYDKVINTNEEEIEEVTKELDPLLTESDREAYKEDVEDLLKDKEQELLIRRKWKTQRDKSAKSNDTTAGVLSRLLRSKVSSSGKNRQKRKRKGKQAQRNSGNSPNDATTSNDQAPRNTIHNPNTDHFLGVGPKPPPARRK